MISCLSPRASKQTSREEREDVSFRPRMGKPDGEMRGKGWQDSHLVNSIDISISSCSNSSSTSFKKALTSAIQELRSVQPAPSGSVVGLVGVGGSWSEKVPDASDGRLSWTCRVDTDVVGETDGSVWRRRGARKGRFPFLGRE